ncbi:MAG TPA: type II toxin-antitoxin system PemK/MazF family toxin [Chloroflexota bacterium]|nr:type II toxin-antitoxin system PemK/MazF family toxin [Chloroflexota bacterium]
MVAVAQGEIYWIDFGSPRGSAPALRRPAVVVQNDIFNETPLHTTVVCVITSNLARAGAPGNVRLAIGEGGLPRESVVNVTQIQTIDKGALEEKIGQLSSARIREIDAGLRRVLRPTIRHRI